MLNSFDKVRSSLLDEDPEARPLVFRFVASLESKVGELGILFLDKEMAALKQKIHSLKGSAALHGYDEFSSILQEFEYGIRHPSGNHAECMSRIEQIKLYSYKILNGLEEA